MRRRLFWIPSLPPRVFRGRRLQRARGVREWDPDDRVPLRVPGVLAGAFLQFLQKRIRRVDELPELRRTRAAFPSLPASDDVAAYFTQRIGFCLFTVDDTNDYAAAHNDSFAHPYRDSPCGHTHAVISNAISVVGPNGDTVEVP